MAPVSVPSVLGKRPASQISAADDLRSRLIRIAVDANKMLQIDELVDELQAGHLSLLEASESLQVSQEQETLREGLQTRACELVFGGLIDDLVWATTSGIITKTNAFERIGQADAEAANRLRLTEAAVDVATLRNIDQQLELIKEGVQDIDAAERLFLQSPPSFQAKKGKRLQPAPLSE